MSIVCSTNCVANCLGIAVACQEEESPTRNIKSRIATRLISLYCVGLDNRDTNAAVIAERMNAALRKLGSALIPASWITITYGDSAAVMIPESRGSPVDRSKICVWGSRGFR